MYQLELSKYFNLKYAFSLINYFGFKKFQKVNTKNKIIFNFIKRRLANHV